MQVRTLTGPGRSASVPVTRMDASLTSTYIPVQTKTVWRCGCASLVMWYGMAGAGGGKLIAQIIDACLSIHHLSGDQLWPAVGMSAFEVLSCR